MTKLKKDGMPAKKPGPKAKLPVIETPGPVGPAALFDASLETTKKIETPETVTFVDGGLLPKVTTIEYKVTGIDTSIGMFQYFKSNQYLDWTDLNGETVSMNLEEWREFLKVLPQALDVLGVKL